MSKVQRAFLLQLLSVALAVGVAVWLSRHYPVMAYLTRTQALVARLGWAGLLLYPLLFGACNVLLLPAGTLALGSGLFFGLWRGLAVNVAGNLVGAAAAMFIGRRLGRGWVRQLLLRRPKWMALDEAVGREGWKIIFLSQLLPFAPSSLLNYLFGVTRVRMRTALFWSALGQLPTMFLYAYLGTFAQFGLNLLRGGAHPRFVEGLTWGGGLLLTILVTAGLARVCMRLLTEVDSRRVPAGPPFSPPALSTAPAGPPVEDGLLTSPP